MAGALGVFEKDQMGHMFGFQRRLEDLVLNE